MKASRRLGRSGPSLGWLLVALLAFSSCGDVTYFADLGAGGGGGAAVGPVTGFGSVKIGGAVFSTDNATIADDQGRSIDNVIEGMVLTVRGTLDQDFKAGSAATVAIEREVRGPVDDDGVALDNNTIRVLGQAVLVNPATVMVRSGGGEFGLGDLKTDVDNNALHPELEVHGWRDGQGLLHAAYIGRGRDNVVADETVWIRGTVGGFDALMRTFLIGEQKVDFTGLPAAGRVNWPLTGLADGMIVDVRGRLDAVGGGGILRTDRTGDRIEGITVSLGKSGDRVTLDGYVLSGTVSSFGLSAPGGSITVNGGAGATGDVFAVRKRVRVKGAVSGSAGTTVQSTSIAVLSPNEVLLEGSPSAISPSGGTLTLLGKTVEVDDFTLFRDGTGTVRKDFGLSSLSTLHTVRVVGFFDGTVSPGKIVATKLERLSMAPASTVTAQGALSASAFPTYTILDLPGIVVSTGLKPNTDYFLKGGVPTDAATFFQDISIGTVVRVKRGIFSDGPPRIAEPDPGSSSGRMEVEIVQGNN